MRKIVHVSIFIMKTEERRVNAGQFQVKVRSVT